MGEYILCAEINGQCKCEQVGARPCSIIVEMYESGTTAHDEFERMEKEREAAGAEDF